MTDILRRCLSHYYYYYHHHHHHHCCCCCCCSTALCWTLAALSVSKSYTQSVGLLGREISPSQGRYLHTEQYKHRINAYNTDIHASSMIQIHDPSVRASEDGSCLRPCGLCDRPVENMVPEISAISNPLQRMIGLHFINFTVVKTSYLFVQIP
jgi:hypothetical protein